MLEVLYTTGIRVSELINLQLSQIDLKNDWIRVLGKGNKTRDVPIGSKAKEALNFYFDMRAKRFGVESDFVFLNSRGSKITRGGFWKQLKNLGKSASINGRVHPHRIRHSTACHLLSNGANLRVIQELYGHASITTTQRYSQVTPQFLKSSVKAAHPRF
jgi:integrase/recombinase XerD